MPFLGNWSFSNASNLLKLLSCFGDASGLQINLHKSRLFGVGVSEDDVIGMATDVDAVLLLYHFLTRAFFGQNMHLTKSWDYVVTKFNSRLNKWMATTLSIGGRLMLIKSVLNSLHRYFFSLFRAPNAVISTLEKICNKYFWDYAGNSRTLIWVSSNKLHGAYESGGVQTSRLTRKMVLLAK